MTSIIGWFRILHSRRAANIHRCRKPLTIANGTGFTSTVIHIHHPALIILHPSSRRQPKGGLAGSLQCSHSMYTQAQQLGQRCCRPLLLKFRGSSSNIHGLGQRNAFAVWAQASFLSTALEVLAISIPPAFFKRLVFLTTSSHTFVRCRFPAHRQRSHRLTPTGHATLIHATVSTSAPTAMAAATIGGRSASGFRTQRSSSASAISGSSLFD